MGREEERERTERERGIPLEKSSNEMNVEKARAPRRRRFCRQRHSSEIQRLQQQPSEKRILSYCNRSSRIPAPLYPKSSLPQSLYTPTYYEQMLVLIVGGTTLVLRERERLRLKTKTNYRNHFLKLLVLLLLLHCQNISISVPVLLPLEWEKI